MRWRIYLQSFTFRIRHIPGRLNLLADYLSRMHEDPTHPANSINAIAIETSLTLKPLPSAEVTLAADSPKKVLDSLPTSTAKSVHWAESSSLCCRRLLVLTAQH